MVIFAGKEAIQTILAEEDLPKAKIYHAFRVDPNVSTLISETDKVKYKQAVRIMRKILTRTNRWLETAFVSCFCNQLSEWNGTTISRMCRCICANAKRQV